MKKKAEVEKKLEMKIDKEFGDVFSESFEQYKLNFKLFFKLYFWLYFIPLLIAIMIIGYIMIGLLVSILGSGALQTIVSGQNTGEFGNAFNKSTLSLTSVFSMTGNTINQNLESSSSLLFTFMLAILLFVLIFSIIQILLYGAIIYVVNNNKNGKMTFGEAFNGGKKYFWKLAGGFCVILAILVGVLIAGIIMIVIGALLGSIGIILIIFSVLAMIGFFIYFTILFMFFPYSIAIDNAKVIDSFKRSRGVVKGRWWKVFGYFCLLMLIMIGVYLVYAIISNIVGVFMGIFILINLILGLIVAGFLIAVLNSLWNLVIMPFMNLFLNNFYIELKKRK
ncbi:hypothetical protein COU57_02180 [Candidatus Pacearchaeota archaeon CG10_big_fil_rev_8_21_14_0_10_32_14]|nr:MAG: hypothetical protein COU57_02180 [Candidatus Pacearchaeota archaeon CG10_big_fil_rev_8_21_14_0_10_32_14]